MHISCMSHATHLHACNSLAHAACRMQSPNEANQGSSSQDTTLEVPSELKKPTLPLSERGTPS